MVWPVAEPTRPANSLQRMTADPKREAMEEVKRAQRDYERNVETAREARWQAPVSRSTLSESHGFVFASTVAPWAGASGGEPGGRAS